MQCWFVSADSDFGRFTEVNWIGWTLQLGARRVEASLPGFDFVEHKPSGRRRATM